MPKPFSGKLFTFANPDGSEIQVRGWGDQNYAVFETLDGYTIVQDPDSGFFQYAKLSDNKQELVPSGVNVGDADPQSLELTPHTRIQREAAHDQANAAPMGGETRRRWEIRRDQKKAGAAGPLSAAGPLEAPPPGTTLGDYVGLCLLIEFPDVPSTISQTDVDNFCNQQGYTGFGNNGSVYDYFYAVSDGKLKYTNVVTVYYTASHNRSYYTDPNISQPIRARELIQEALNHLVANGFNFGQLSSDSGGYIYALNVFYAGPCVNYWAQGLWPHSWHLATAYNVTGGKKFYDYQITDMSSELTLGTYCHENGHMICDFPDLYDYGYESTGVGNYCLMCYGGSDKNPVQVCAYLKNEAGWTTQLTPITSEMTASIEAGKNDFYIYTRNSTEYFIFENRQKTGRDASLPDNGLAIWHVDENGDNDNEQMTASQHYECSLEQADYRFDMEHNANAGDAEDLFGAPGAVSFDNNSSPNSRWWGGSDSRLKIFDISKPGPTMTFKVELTPSSSCVCTTLKKVASVFRIRT